MKTYIFLAIINNSHRNFHIHPRGNFFKNDSDIKKDPSVKTI